MMYSATRYTSSTFGSASRALVRLAAPVLVALLFCASSLLAQTVSGTVKDADGTLSGVVIKVKGSNKGAISDKNGKYSLAVAPEDKALVFNLVGYAKKEVAIEGRSTIDVVMALDLQRLNDVVVVGYGSASKRDLSGNTAKVKASDIASMPVPTFDVALQGKAAGVVISSGSGKLGGAIQVRVRGQSSISASSEPLYVVDGVPITNSIGEFNQGDLNTGGQIPSNPLVDINPQDIESIDILKDAAAAAIYGARGANGVVVVTTKRGKIGRTNVNVSFQQGFSEPSRYLGFLDAKQYEQYYIQASKATDRIRGRDTSASNSRTVSTKNFLRNQGLGLFGTDKAANTNWEREAMRSGAYSQADFSLSGANENTSFFASGQYLDQKGILVGNQLTRFSGRLNVEQRVSDIFKAGFNVSIARSLNQRLAGDRAFSNPLQASALPPVTPLNDPVTGLPVGSPPGDINLPLYYNPFLNIGNSSRDLTVLRNIGSVFGELQLFEGLSFRTEFGFDVAAQEEYRYSGVATARNSNAALGLAQAFNARTENFNVNSFFSYNRVFDVHSLDLTAGFQYQRSQIRDVFAEARDFPSDAFKMLTAGGRKTDALSTQKDFSFVSYFARANYKLLDRYLLSGSVRLDGSSRFGTNNRYGLFPAVSAGWIISQEDFLRDNDVLSTLKLRASYGRTGNAEIPNYASRPLVNGDAAYNGVPGQRLIQLANNDLTWETTDQVDAGLEFGFFSNRITGEVDVYSKVTTGLLLDVNVPYPTGFSTQFKNIGSMQNSGIELVLNTENVVEENFTWRTNINVALNNNRILDIGGQIIEGGLESMTRLIKDQPIGSFYTVEYAGVDKANGNALFYKNTTPGDRTTTSNYAEAQRVLVGSALPTLTGGITNTISAFGFDFSFMFSGQYGNKINFFGMGQYSSSNARYRDNQTVDQLKSWTPTNTVTDIPEARSGLDNGNQASSRFIYDGSFLRLRNATLAYNFPKSVLESIKLNSLRVFVTGQNLLLFTNYRGWDPEVNADDVVSNIAQGYDFYTAPQPRTITFGINVGF
jgi:TonB-dependent starch-binding outer membrane protein SusC